MRRRMLKKSEVIREGYVRGLRKAQRIINEMIAQGFDDDGLSTSSGNSMSAGVSFTSNARNTEMGLELIEACKNGYWETAMSLINKGADVNAKDKTDYTPLHWAAWRNQKSICTLLLNHGADVNAKDKQGETPLQHAAFKGHTDICKKLLDAGADVNAKDKEGWTPMSCALYLGHTETSDLLRQYGAEGLPRQYGEIAD